MYIFIDESGSFTVPRNGKSSLGIIGALVVPEKFIRPIVRDTLKLKKMWQLGKGELKGRELHETQVRYVISMLNSYDVLYLPVAVDLGIHSDEEISLHRNNQADRILSSIPSGANPKLILEMRDSAERVRKLSNSLYLQFQILTILLSDVIHRATLYYVQRHPKEIGSFRWYIDTKSPEKKSEYEEIWSLLAGPFLQSDSLRNPAIQINGEDYSHFKRFEREDAEAPSYLKKKVEPGPFRSIDLKLLLNESLKFADSNDYTGLQLIDVLCNCLRRACHGNLAEHGWRNLGKLTLTAKKGSSSVRLLSFNTKEESTVSYAGVIKLMDAQAKPLVLKK